MKENIIRTNVTNVLTEPTAPAASSEMRPKAHTSTIPMKYVQVSWRKIGQLRENTPMPPFCGATMSPPSP